MKENYVTDPEMNKQIDEFTYAMLQFRDIYYVPEYNAFMCFKRMSDEGKVYSDLCNFLQDSTTTVGNMLVSDDYVKNNCILIKDIETLDKYAFQKDQSIDLPATKHTPALSYRGGTYTVFRDEADLQDDIQRYNKLWNVHEINPNFKKLPHDPLKNIDLDFDFPELDDMDDMDMDY